MLFGWCVMGKWLRVCLLLFVCMGICVPTPWAAKKTKAKRTQKADMIAYNHIGDISVRLDVGVEIVRFSGATGEFLTEWILERTVRLRFNPEYGYFLSNNLTLFISLPFEFDIDPLVGTTFNMDLGAGGRYYLGQIFFVDARVLLRFVSRSRFVFAFGGLVIGVGAAIPLSQQVRLLLTLRVPLEWDSGPRARIQTYGGLEVLF